MSSSCSRMRPACIPEAHLGMPIGVVRSVSIKTGKHADRSGVDGALALAGHGFDGDVHADPLSPRQVLLASAAVYDECRLPAHALGENLLVDIDTTSLASGTVLQLGAHMRIRLMFQCEACGQLDLQRPGLARAIGNRRGMLARVITSGRVQVGDTVVQENERLPSWSDDWRERVRAVLDAVPPGFVVDYARLARLAGIQASYCRAFPRLLARLDPHYADKAVPARSASGATRWDGSGLFGRS